VIIGRNGSFIILVWTLIGATLNIFFNVLYACLWLLWGIYSLLVYLINMKFRRLYDIGYDYYKLYLKVTVLW